jgi:hypothetical protein
MLCDIGEAFVLARASLRIVGTVRHEMGVRELTFQLSCERIHKIQRRSRCYHSSFASFNER